MEAFKRDLLLAMRSSGQYGGVNEFTKNAHLFAIEMIL